jgi:hypothetical protein
MGDQIAPNTQACTAGSIQQDKNKVLNYLRRERERRMETELITTIETPSKNSDDASLCVSSERNYPRSLPGATQEGLVDRRQATLIHEQPVVEHKVNYQHYFKALDKWLDITGYHDLEYRSRALEEHKKTGRNLKCKIDVHHNATSSTDAMKPMAAVLQLGEPNKVAKKDDASSRYGIDMTL